MPDPIIWFIDKILPYITIAICGGGFALFRRVDKLHYSLDTITRDFHHLTTIMERKWQEVDIQLKDDVKELKEQIDYMSKNYISRDELNQYLTMLHNTVERLTKTLDKVL